MNVSKILLCIYFIFVPGLLWFVLCVVSKVISWSHFLVWNLQNLQFQVKQPFFRQLRWIGFWMDFTSRFPEVITRISFWEINSIVIETTLKRQIKDFQNFSGINLLSATLQNGQIHSNNSSTVADELFECVWPSYGVGA